MKKWLFLCFLFYSPAVFCQFDQNQNERSHEQQSQVSPGRRTDLIRASANLTEKIESENFIFHFKPGDGVRAEIERSEAFHRWAINYLGVRPPKKIDFYMFPTMEEMSAAFGMRFGGSAFPDEFALATAFSWHNHECFHLYTLLIGNPPRIFAEGMVIAHEFDPHNNVWISQWNRAKPYPEPHIEIARQLKANGHFYPLDAILESDDFNRLVGKETFKIAYEQAGAWVSYLIEKYGLAKMKQIISGIPYHASADEIKKHFKEVYGLSVAAAEAEWLAWLSKKRNGPCSRTGKTKAAGTLTFTIWPIKAF